MQNPLKTINDLAMDRSRHHERLIHLELFQRAANQRLAGLEKDTSELEVSRLEAIDRLTKRIEALEKQVKPPVGLDGPKLRKGDIWPGGIPSRVLDYLKEQDKALTPSEVAKALGESKSSVNTAMIRLVNKGLLESPAWGRYTLPSKVARAVGQRNGR